MIPLLLSLLTLIAPANWQEQKEKIPPLREEDVVAVILFEVKGITEADIEITEIKQLEELAQVSVKIKSLPYTFKFECKKTDFGPKWRLAEDLPSSLKEPAAETGITKPEITDATGQKENPRPRLPKEDSKYREFLTGFLEALQGSEEVNIADYYFRDDEFDYTASKDPKEVALRQVADGRSKFIEQCAALREKLRAYENFKVVSYFAGDVTRSTMAALKALVPAAKFYLSTVSVEITADEKLGRITFEGVTLVGTSWRIGAITEIELP